jgi:hypothetical protein
MSRVSSLANARGLKEEVQDVSKQAANASAVTRREEGESETELHLDPDRGGGGP